jgi:hypothetical protein
MHHRVYSGPKDSPDLSPLEKSQMLFKEFTVLDDALSWARHLEGTGRIPLLIEGDDGTRGTVAPSSMRYGQECVSNWAISRAGHCSSLGSEPAPFGAGSRREMVPIVADNIPVDHWTLRDGRAVGIRHRMARVIEIGAANRY